MKSDHTLNIHQLVWSIYDLPRMCNLCTSYLITFWKLIFDKNAEASLERKFHQQSNLLFHLKEYLWIRNPHYKIHILHLYLTDFPKGYQEKINCQKLYIRLSLMVIYWVINFEETNKWVSVGSIIGQSLKLLIFICLVSVNWWVFAVAKSLTGLLELGIISLYFSSFLKFL